MSQSAARNIGSRIKNRSSINLRNNTQNSFSPTNKAKSKLDDSVDDLGDTEQASNSDFELDDLGDGHLPAKPQRSKAKSIPAIPKSVMAHRASVDKIRLAFPTRNCNIEELAANLESHMGILKEDGLSERKSATGEAYKLKYLVYGDGGTMYLLAHPKNSNAENFLEVEFSFGKANAGGKDVKLLREIINATYYEHAKDALAAITILNMELAIDIDRPFSSLLFGCKNKHAFEVWRKSMSSSAESILFGSRDSERYATAYDLQAAEDDDLAYSDLLKYRKNKRRPADFDDYYPKARLTKPRALEAKASRNKHTMPESTRIEFRATKLKLPLREADSFTMIELTAIQVFDAGNFAKLCKTLELQLFLELARCIGVSAAMAKLEKNDKERFTRLFDQAKLDAWKEIDVAKLIAKALRELRLALTQ